jgi:hypothetical protein
MKRKRSGAASIEFSLLPADRKFVPPEAQRHAEHVADRQPVAAVLLGKIGTLRKLLVELRLWCRRLAVDERNAIDETNTLLDTDRRSCRARGLPVGVYGARDRLYP